MSITSYSELKTAITDWTHRADLASFADDFIDLCESRLNRELRMSDMETRATITATGEYVALPSGFLEARNVQVNTTPVQVMEYKTPAQMDRDNAGSTGTPNFYSIIGNEFQLYPVPTSSVIEVTYYKSITPLDSTNTANFLLTSHPEIYLNGCLMYAYLYTKDAASMAFHEQEFSRLVGELNSTSRNKKFSGAPLRVVSA